VVLRIGSTSDLGNDLKKHIIISGTQSYLDATYNGSCNLLSVNQDLSSTQTIITNKNINYSRNYFIDIDNDGDKDLHIVGNDPHTDVPYNLIFENQNSIFVEITNQFPRLKNAAIEWVDLDKDGDKDLILCGYYYSGYDLCKIYLNQGGFNFIESSYLINGYSNVHLKSFDINNDNLIDIIISGSGFTHFYINSGSSFEFENNLSLCFGGNFDFGDYNNDGYFDLLIADNGHTLLFENNNGVFSQTNETFEEVTQGTGIFGDYDNDGDLDSPT
jgi:hypothetical protein